MNGVPKIPKNKCMEQRVQNNIKLIIIKKMVTEKSKVLFLSTKQIDTIFILIYKCQCILIGLQIYIFYIF